jgi:hypothetical protein
VRVSRARIAAVLWIAWAVIVWNVVLDQTIVLAGRRYVVAAVAAAQGPGSYARIDDWMRPAVTRGLWFATASAATILAVGFVSLRLAPRPPDSPSPHRSTDCASSPIL